MRSSSLQTSSVGGLSREKPSTSLLRWRMKTAASLRGPLKRRAPWESLDPPRKAWHRLSGALLPLFYLQTHSSA